MNRLFHTEAEAADISEPGGCSVGVENWSCWKIGFFHSSMHAENPQYRGSAEQNQCTSCSAALGQAQWYSSDFFVSLNVSVSCRKPSYKKLFALKAPLLQLLHKHTCCCSEQSPASRGTITQTWVHLLLLIIFIPSSSVLHCGSDTEKHQRVHPMRHYSVY